MTEQRGHRIVAAQVAQLTATSFPPPDAATGVAENTFREEGFARAGRAGEQDRVGRTQSDPLNAIDQFIEGGVVRINPGFQKRDRLLLFALKTAGERGVAA